MMISILIATKDRSSSLQDTLESLLLQQNVNSIAYEVIVVDNGSRDQTKVVVEDFQRKSKMPVRYILESQKGKSYALNTGIQSARGEVIAFTDDDVICETNWLFHIFQHMQSVDFDALGGKVLPDYLSSPPRWIEKNIQILNGPVVVHNYGDALKNYDSDMLPFLGANMAIRKKVFNDCGLFKLNLGPGQGTYGEDTEMFRRLEKAKKKVVYCGDVVVRHKVETKRMNFGYIRRWHVESGKSYVYKTPEDYRKCKLFFGIPRYLFRQFFQEIFYVLLFSWKQKLFLKHYCRLYTTIGLIQGSWELKQSESS